MQVENGIALKGLVVAHLDKIFIPRYGKFCDVWYHW